MNLDRDELVTIYQALEVSIANLRIVLMAENDSDRRRMYANEVKRLQELRSKITSNYPENKRKSVSKEETTK